MIILQSKNPMVHINAGNLLMTTGSYEDAIKAFTNANSVQLCPVAIYQRAWCYLALGDISAAYNDLALASNSFDENRDFKRRKLA